MQTPEGKAEGQASSDDNLALPDHHSQQGVAEDGGQDYLKLRRLVLGSDYADAIERYLAKEPDLTKLVENLPEALHESSQEDLSESLAPVVDQALGKSIEQNPSRITNIIFPIMGPAVRKAVAAALADMVQTLNTLLEQSLSLGSLKWRIKAWRASMPYAEYVLLQTIEFRVEQVLLVHRETGLLLNSVTAPEVITQDPELVSSMLTAIGDFVSDSFSAGKETLEKIRVGDLELHLYVGPLAILAIAVRGTASDELVTLGHETIEKIHARFAPLLQHFEGDRADFDEAVPVLSECLIHQEVAPKKKGKPWLAGILIIAGLAYLVYQSLLVWQQNQEFNLLEAAVNKQAGYLVITSKREDTHLYVTALREVGSLSPQELEQSLSKQYGVDISINAQLMHFGPLPEAEVKPKTGTEQIQLLVDKLQNTVFYFAPGEIQLSALELEKIPEVVNAIQEIERLATAYQLHAYQIILMGFADSEGSSATNIKVSKQRAEEIKSLLSANHIDSDILVTWGVGHIDNEGVTEQEKRRVSLQMVPRAKNESLTEDQEHTAGSSNKRAQGASF